MHALFDRPAQSFRQERQHAFGLVRTLPLAEPVRVLLELDVQRNARRGGPEAVASRGGSHVVGHRAQRRMHFQDLTAGA